jgi:hypothetical protein
MRVQLPNLQKNNTLAEVKKPASDWRRPALKQVEGKNFICSSSYDDSFSGVSYVCVWRSYDAFFSYHKAYFKIFFWFKNANSTPLVTSTETPGFFY